MVAVDVGSTSARAGLFDAAGHYLGRALAPFATARPLPHHARARFRRDLAVRLHPRARRRRLRANELSGLAFDPTCLLAVFDRSGDKVTVSTTGDDCWNVMMWADHRATAEAAAITAAGHRSPRHVGGVMSPEGCRSCSG